jgi:hypothetical protein
LDSISRKEETGSNAYPVSAIEPYGLIPDKQRLCLVLLPKYVILLTVAGDR